MTYFAVSKDSVSWKFLSSYFTDCLIRHFFRTINFRQFRKKYALPNDRAFSFANLYIKCIFVNIFNHFLQQGSMPAYIDMIISLKVCGAEVSCYYSLECIEQRYLKKKNHYPRNRAARYCAVLQFILLIKQSLTGVVKTKPLMKRKCMLANYYNLIFYDLFSFILEDIREENETKHLF